MLNVLLHSWLYTPPSMAAQLIVHPSIYGCIVDCTPLHLWLHSWLYTPPSMVAKLIVHPFITCQSLQPIPHSIQITQLCIPNMHHFMLISHHIYPIVHLSQCQYLILIYPACIILHVDILMYPTCTIPFTNDIRVFQPNMVEVKLVLIIIMYYLTLVVWQQ